MATLPSSNPKAFTYEILYYEGYGLGEAGRLIVRAGELTLENSFVDDDTLPQFKPTLLFGQVPRLRVKDKDGNVVFEVVQSRAIVKYLATITGIAGKTPEESAAIEQFFEAIKDSNMAASSVWWEPERKTLVAEIVKPDGPIHKECKKYDDFLATSTYGFLVHNTLSYADLMLFIFEEESSILLGGISEYKNLTAHKEKIASIPSVKAYITDPTRVKSFYALPDVY